MFTDDTLGFLSDLSANNTRDWFTENRERYETQYRAPAGEYMDRLSAFLEGQTGLLHEPKLFRIHRDLRFARDKTPYNPHVHISFVPRDPAGLSPVWMAGLATEYFSLGCGLLAFDAAGLVRYRENVAGERGPALADLLARLAAGGVRLSEPDLKRVTAPYGKSHPMADLLRRKGLAGWIDADARDGLGQAGIAASQAGFARLRPLFDLMRSL